MITFEKISGDDCSNQGYQHYLDNHLNVSGWVVENLGESQTVGLDMYGLSRGLETNKPTIFIQSSVHGDEYPSAFWARQFARYISNNELAPPSTRHLFKLLDNAFSFFWIPIANPWGYDKLQRFNENNVNSNADYSSNQTQKEPIIIKNKIRQLKPALLIDNHTWDDIKTPCHRLYARKAAGVDSQHKIINNNWLKSTEFITKETVYEYWYPAPVDHLHSWSTYQISNSGDNCMTALIEGDKKKANQTQVTQGINAMLTVSMYFYCWYKYRLENPSNDFLD